MRTLKEGTGFIPFPQSSLLGPALSWLTGAKQNAGHGLPHSIPKCALPGLGILCASCCRGGPGEMGALLWALPSSILLVLPLCIGLHSTAGKATRPPPVLGEALLHKSVFRVVSGTPRLHSGGALLLGVMKHAA